MSPARSLALTVAGLLISTLGSFGCERKAPGPEECSRFAVAVVQYAAGSPFLLTPEMQVQIDEQTRQCLTRPYDRELLNCVLSQGHARPCLEAFRRRKGTPEPGVSFETP